MNSATKLLLCLEQKPQQLYYEQQWKSWLTTCRHITDPSISKNTEQILFYTSNMITIYMLFSFMLYAITMHLLNEISSTTDVTVANPYFNNNITLFSPTQYVLNMSFPHVSKLLLLRLLSFNTFPSQNYEQDNDDSHTVDGVFS